MRAKNGMYRMVSIMRASLLRIITAILIVVTIIFIGYLISTRKPTEVNVPEEQPIEEQYTTPNSVLYEGYENLSGSFADLPDVDTSALFDESNSTQHQFGVVYKIMCYVLGDTYDPNLADSQILGGISDTMYYATVIYDNKKYDITINEDVSYEVEVSNE